MKAISYLKILVPTAGPIPARERADDIVRIAYRLKGELIIMNILTYSTAGDLGKRREGEEALDIFSKAAERRGVRVTGIIQEGELVKTIKDYAESENIDLIVMGAGEDRIVAEWIISDLKEQSNVPVVVIPYGFSSII